MKLSKLFDCLDIRTELFDTRSRAHNSGVCIKDI